MRNTILIAVRTTIFTLVLTGLAYPLLVTGAARAVFPWRSGGSLVTDDRDRVVGSELIGQAFASPGYFQPRPSAAGRDGYDGTSSSGSNYGPTSKPLRDRCARDLERLRAENPDATGLVPAELVTASASGLDPHISVRAALWQVPRVSRDRRVAPERIISVVEANIAGRDLGFMGEERVNVLLLNLALDRQFGRPAQSDPRPQR